MSMRALLRLVVCGGAGALLALAFPPFDQTYFAPLSVAVLTAVLWRVRWPVAVGGGLVAGLAFNLILLDWARVLGLDAWIALSLVMALWWIVLGLGTAATTWVRWWPLAVPGLWVFAEAARSRIPWGGFPWGRLAFAAADTLLTPWASLFGASAVTFGVALIGTLLLWTARLAWERDWLSAVGGLLALAGVILAGLVIPLPTDGQSISGPASTRLAVVQGGVPRNGLDFNAQRRQVLANHVAETARLAGEVTAGRVPRPEAVIWPENSSDVDPNTDAFAADAITGAAEAIDAPILVGAVLRVPGNLLWNVGIVWDPVTGPGERYVKQHPVPFGEYLPGRSLLTSFITRFDRIPYDFAPGDSPGVLQVGPARLGDVICFEIAYDALVRATVDAGARALVVQTNNATYGDTAQPAQQLAMSKLRAVEHGRSVLVAATSGISAIIAPDGSIVQQLPPDAAASMVQSVALRDARTLADRLDWWPEAALSLLGACGWVAGAIVRRKRLKSGA